MGVSTHTYDDVLTHLHMCVLQRRPLIVAERQHIAHGKPGVFLLNKFIPFILSNGNNWKSGLPLEFLCQLSFVWVFFIDFFN